MNLLFNYQGPAYIGDKEKGQNQTFVGDVSLYTTIKVANANDILDDFKWKKLLNKVIRDLQYKAARDLNSRWPFLVIKKDRITVSKK